MCKHPIHIEVRNNYITPFFPLHRYAYYVPCGKCLDCLKRRQTDYSTRIYREARKGQKMFFLTLTYRDDALPIAKRLYFVDTETGELEARSNFELETDSSLLFRLRSEFGRIEPSEKARYVDIDVHSKGTSKWFARFTPSLCRLDVRMWLKKSRIQYKRDFGKPLPDFSYAFCGEYGGLRSRPHYHCLFFGLDNEQIEFLSQRWQKAFGYTLAKEIPVLNPDGSDARMIVSKYVGKYISKGKFDLDSVKCRDCEKGRLCNSLRLGSRFTDEEVAYFRCYDLYGAYNIETMQTADGIRYLTKDEIHAIAVESIKRNAITISSYKLPMPRALRYHLWYYKIKLYDKASKTEKVFLKRSPILAEVETILRNKFAAEGLRKYKTLYPERDVSALCPEFFAEFFQLCQSSEEDTNEAKEEALFQAAYYQGTRDFQ